jgi:hypothetical protein
MVYAIMMEAGWTDMTQEQIKEVFIDYGYERWWDEICYPLLSSGILDAVDQDVLVTFFEIYAFPVDEVCSFMEFMVHFSIFKRLYASGINGAWL